MIRARRRSIYCSPAEWAEIAGKAGAADMSISAFLIACGLAEDREEPPDTLLALTEDEQRTQYKRIEYIDRWARAMCERMPGSEFTMLDALYFLERAARAGAKERRRRPETPE